MKVKMVEIKKKQAESRQTETVKKKESLGREWQSNTHKKTHEKHVATQINAVGNNITTGFSAPESKKKRERSSDLSLVGARKPKEKKKKSEMSTRNDSNATKDRMTWKLLDSTCGREKTAAITVCSALRRITRVTMKESWRMLRKNREGMAMKRNVGRWRLKSVRP
jgi:hypothetical protein